MVYLRCEKRVRTENGKFRLNEVNCKKRLTSQFKDFTCEFQASLPGFFFENSESARHNGVLESKVSGILTKEIINKENKDA